MISGAPLASDYAQDTRARTVLPALIRHRGHLRTRARVSSPTSLEHFPDDVWEEFYEATR